MTVADLLPALQDVKAGQLAKPYEAIGEKEKAAEWKVVEEREEEKK